MACSATADTTGDCAAAALLLLEAFDISRMAAALLNAPPLLLLLTGRCFGGGCCAFPGFSGSFSGIGTGLSGTLPGNDLLAFSSEMMDGAVASMSMLSGI